MSRTLENHNKGNIKRRKQKLQKQKQKQRLREERQLQRQQGKQQKQREKRQEQNPRNERQEVSWQTQGKKRGKSRVALIMAAVCLTLVAAAFAAAYYVKQREGTQETHDGPTIPRVSFYVGEHKVNTLVGYAAEMDIPSMRDTITPTPEDGQLKMEIESDGQQLGALKYELRSLDGREQYAQTTISALGNFESSTITLNLRDILEREVREAVLVVTLQVDEREVHYYTRVTRPQELTTLECIEFAKDFHEKAFNKKSGAELESYLEPGEKSDNTTLQTVNIYSNVYHIRWGELEPRYFTEPEWSVKESNTVYSSILAKYQVICEGETGEQELYNVREFFRIRKDEDEDKLYLLDYERTMNQVFNGSGAALSESGILLGMVREPVSFETNAEGNIVCFVQERELWSFDKENNRFVCIFSFADDAAGTIVQSGEDGGNAAKGGGNASGEDEDAAGSGSKKSGSKKEEDVQPVRGGTDARCRNDEHDVRIIHVADDGSITFAVTGYMNSGNHEGEVGVDVFYYDAEAGEVTEKAFLPGTKAFAVTEYELGKLVYYSEKKQTLYVLTGGTLYQMNVGRLGQEVLAEGLSDGQYVVSDDGHLLAWQTDGGTGAGNAVRVLDLETEETFEVKASEGQYVKPLGFVYEDFVCGYAAELDAGILQGGEFCLPMYRLEIRSLQNQVVKEYEPAGLYVLNIDVADNLVTINRVARVDGVYSMTTPDYVSNNEGRAGLNVELETYSTDLKERQKRLVFEDGVEEDEVSTVWPNRVLSADSTVSVENAGSAKLYYVYGGGRLAAVCENAGQAVRLAEELSGVVTSWNQSYVWEKGNRDLSYYTDVDAFSKQEGQSSLDSCLAYMQRYGEVERMDLSGCTLSQILYVVNQGMPVIVMTDMQHAILLTGYNVETATYVDPDIGVERTVIRDEMEQMVAAGGNTFIGFVK